MALNEADFILKLDGLFSDGGWRWPSIHLDSKLSLTQSLGLIIPRSQYVSGYVSERVFGHSSRIRHRNALTEKAWEDALQGIAKHALRLGEGGQNHDETTPPPPPKKSLAPSSRAPHLSWERALNTGLWSEMSHIPGPSSCLSARANGTRARARLKFRTFCRLSLECWLVWNSVVGKCGSGREKLRTVQNPNSNTIFIIIW